MAAMGGPAFPVRSVNTNNGMYLRDYFAAQVSPSIYEGTRDSLRASGRMVDNIYTIVAIASYELADEMLKARTKESI